MLKRSLMSIAGLLLATITSAAISADLAVDWWTIDGGGEMFTVSGDLELSGTIGQPDASQLVMTADTFELTGGFWAVSINLQVPGDCDGDGFVDIDDLAIFAPCMTGPDVGVESGCQCADLDADGDADLADFVAFQQAFTGQ